MSKVQSAIVKIKTDKKIRSVARTSGAIVVLAAVLFLGIGIGKGTITFGEDAKYRKALDQNGSGRLSYNGIDEVYNALKEEYDGDLDTAKLEDGLKEGLVKAAGDPYTEYFNAEQNKKFTEQIDGSFEGIGATLGKDGEAITIIAPIEGSPAQKAGVKAKDIIAKINGENALDLKLDEAVNKIRGQKGTIVKLDLVREGKPVIVEITRDTISIPSVKWEVNADNVGIITISQFGKDTAELTNKAALELKSKNVKGIVLDMRGNPGGLLDSAVRVSSLWLPQGKTILQEKRGGQVVKTYTANGNDVLVGVPTVVLLDGGSASASEITAGALKDNGVATIVGTKSYGKGSVQDVRQLLNGAALKVTIARWYTPNGRNIDKDGIEPDQKVEISDADIAALRDTQKNTALTKLQ